MRRRRKSRGEALKRKTPVTSSANAFESSRTAFLTNANQTLKESLADNHPPSLWVDALDVSTTHEIDVALSLSFMASSVGPADRDEERIRMTAVCGVVAQLALQHHASVEDHVSDGDSVGFRLRNSRAILCGDHLLAKSAMMAALLGRSTQIAISSAITTSTEAGVVLTDEDRVKDATRTAQDLLRRWGAIPSATAQLLVASEELAAPIARAAALVATITRLMRSESPGGSTHQARHSASVPCTAQTDDVLLILSHSASRARRGLLALPGDRALHGIAELLEGALEASGHGSASLDPV
jgi:hypothetical protein